MTGVLHATSPARKGALHRNNVRVAGHGRGRPLVFAHGLGCDQAVWQRLTPHFADDHTVVLLDHVGAGGSDSSAYDRSKYDSLHGYADDVVEVCEALDLQDAVLVAHSVSAMIGVLAAPRARGRIGGLVLVAPSPCYLDDPATGYHGGFARTDIDDLLETMSSNYLGWTAAMTPVIMGNADRPELAQELADSFCRTDPAIVGHFAEVTFLSDTRAYLPEVDVPTLVLQCSEDALAPESVGTYVHQQIPGSELALLSATGHCPHVSAPEETAAAVAAFLGRL
jgi:sigma-B regulation protein RsbQ